MSKFITGSFFNQVPNRDDDKEENKKEGTGDNSSHTTSNNPYDPSLDMTSKRSSQTPAMESSSTTERVKQDPFDQSIADLLRRRKSKPLASTPSTLGGIPTAKASGFSKSQTRESKSISQDKKSFIAIGKPFNDITKPEYDDQGYTLYADEETGVKKRVFEALVDYPCNFTMKIIGDSKDGGNFAAEIVQVVAETCEVGYEDVSYTERKNGKWTSVTVIAPVKSAEMLYSIYENVDRDPRVKFKF